jgi:uncharacterized OB-fold protein
MTTTEAGTPRPTLFGWNRPFFAGGLEGKLMLQRCTRCHHLIYYPRMLCPRCFSPDYQWERLSGRGTVYSFSIVWHPNHPAFTDQIPIVLVVVDLAEGPQMVATLMGCPPETVSIGMEVSVVFDSIAPDVALPRFVPRT